MERTTSTKYLIAAANALERTHVWHLSHVGVRKVSCLSSVVYRTCLVKPTVTCRRSSSSSSSTSFLPRPHSTSDLPSAPFIPYLISSQEANAIVHPFLSGRVLWKQPAERPVPSSLLACLCASHPSLRCCLRAPRSCISRLSTFLRQSGFGQHANCPLPKMVRHARKLLTRTGFPPATRQRQQPATAIRAVLVLAVMDLRFSSYKRFARGAHPTSCA